MTLYGAPSAGTVTRVPAWVLIVTAVTLLVVVCALLLVATHWEVFRAMVGWGMAALVLLMLCALAIGHALGGPHADDRTSLAVACATRHFGVALLVATAFPGPRTATLIAAYLLATSAVTLPYLRWRLHRTHAQPPAPPRAEPAPTRDRVMPATNALGSTMRGMGHTPAPDGGDRR